MRRSVGLNTESFKRFAKRFEELSLDQQSQIADDICDPAKARPKPGLSTTLELPFSVASASSVSLAITATAKTWKSLGYVGNISVGGPYPGVPAEIIEKLGLQDVV